MSSTSSAEATPFPTRRVYDHSREELTIIVDAFPATVEDVTVAVGSRRIRIRVEHDGTVYDRTISPPRYGHAFADDGEAVYNNGVLSITVGTTPVSRLRR